MDSQSQSRMEVEQYNRAVCALSRTEHGKTLLAVWKRRYGLRIRTGDSTHAVYYALGKRDFIDDLLAIIEGET